MNASRLPSSLIGGGQAGSRSKSDLPSRQINRKHSMNSRILLGSLTLGCCIIQCASCGHAPKWPSTDQLHGYDSLCTDCRGVDANAVTYSLVGARRADGGLYVYMCVRGSDKEMIGKYVPRLAERLSLDEDPNRYVEIVDEDNRPVALRPMRRGSFIPLTRMVQYVPPPITFVSSSDCVTPEASAVQMCLFRTASGLHDGVYRGRFTEAFLQSGTPWAAKAEVDRDWVTFELQ